MPPRNPKIEAKSPEAVVEGHFHDFAEHANEFSKLILTYDASVPANLDPASVSAETNLTLAKTIFGKWTIEILSLLYARKSMGFQELANSLGGVSTRVLSAKLNTLESKRIVMRTVIGTKPPRVRYGLTGKGITLAKIGEPVFLYLRFTEGMADPQPGVEPIRQGSR